MTPGAEGATQDPGTTDTTVTGEGDDATEQAQSSAPEDEGDGGSSSTLPVVVGAGVLLLGGIGGVQLARRISARRAG